MQTSETTHQRAHAFMAALARRDAAALSSLFAGEPAYADPSRPGVSRGRGAVRGHLELLCQALDGTRIVTLDVLVDHESACARWMAELPAPHSHALDAVTWLRTVDDGIEEARSYFDASVFLPAARPHDGEAVPLAAVAGPGAPLTMRGQDSRGVTFDLDLLRGHVVCLLAAGRGVQDEAQTIAETLGESFAGDARVALVVLLDITDIPRPLRAVARSAMASLRAQAVRRFKEGFERAGKAVPGDVENLTWFVPDYEGGLFGALGLGLPLKEAELFVIDGLGRLVGRYAGGREAGQRAAAQCRVLLSTVG